MGGSSPVLSPEVMSGFHSGEESSSVLVDHTLERPSQQVSLVSPYWFAFGEFAFALFHSVTWILLFDWDTSIRKCSYNCFDQFPCLATLRTSSWSGYAWHLF